MFNLSFLNASALIALTAVVLPLLIYLFARKRPPRLIFSSIRFIRLSQKKKKKRMNITNILLLIIRMLIILLVVLAIARPAVKLDSLRDKTDHPPTALAIIIDNSYSMNYVVDTQTCLDKSLAQAEIIRNMLNSNDVCCLFTLDKNWNDLNSGLHYGSFPEDILRSIDITSKTLTLNDVIKQAQERLKESHLPNREIHFLTDMQKQDEIEELSNRLFVISAAEIQNRQNQSIQKAHPAASFIEKTDDLKIIYEVVNNSSADAEDVICSLQLNGKTVAEQITDLMPHERKWNSFQFPLEYSGWQEGFVSVKDERLLYDNRYYFCFYKENNPQVAVITSRQYVPPVLNTILEIYTGNLNNIHLISQDLSLDMLEGFSNIIVWEYDKWNPRTTAVLNALNEQKRNVLYLTGIKSEKNYRDYIQKTFKLEFSGLLSDTTAVKISSMNTYHPLAARFAADRPAAVRDIWRVKTTADIVLSAQDYPLVLENKGNVLWLFDINTLRSDFLVDANFPILAYNSLNYTAASAAGKRQFITGDLFRPENGVIRIPDDETINTAGRMLSLDKTGIYREGNNMIPLAVNLDFRESDFRKWEKPENDRIIFCQKDWQNDIFAARYGFELWKYLLAAALLLFILEIAIIKRAEKKAILPENSANH